MDDRRLGPARTDGRREGGIVLAVTLWNICEKRGQRDDGSANEGFEHEACSLERPMGGTSGVPPLTEWASATVA